MLTKLASSVSPDPKKMKYFSTDFQHSNNLVENVDCVQDQCSVFSDDVPVDKNNETSVSVDRTNSDGGKSRATVGGSDLMLLKSG